ncbi:MAG: hypothetical protein AB7V13_24745 [Pseudorhodoplanes sp.]|uniref:hypothetical protein n=1 Tax=Pseudorhodoplanes sp. TaxID=1934341 RepID=UPI003D140F87
MRAQVSAGVGAVAMAVLVATSFSALAAEVERPATYSPGKIPGIRAAGPNYTILNPVRSDGFLRIYSVRSPYGNFTVVSDAMMQVRIRELAAVAELDKLTESNEFNNALGQAGLAPVKFAGELLVNPLETLNNTFTGLGNQIGQIGSGISNAGKSQDQAFGGFGADQKRRELAAKLGVDPYSDYEPLQSRLQKLSQAAAAGGLVVSGAMMAIPGAVGIVISNVGTSGKVKDSLRDRTAAQLMDMNREKMMAMGLDRGTADALLQNRNYTPLDMTSMVSSLEVVPVPGRAEFLRRAVAVKRRDAAVFNRRYTEMVADYHLKNRSIVSYVSVAEFPFNQTANGAVVGIWPVDALSWTEGTQRAATSAASAIRANRLGRPELRISGQATPRAKEGLRELGFSIAENTRR